MSVCVWHVLLVDTNRNASQCFVSNKPPVGRRSATATHIKTTHAQVHVSHRVPPNSYLLMIHASCRGNNCIDPFTHSCMHLLTHSCIYSLTHSFIHSSIHTFIHSLIHSCIHALTTHPFMCLITHPFMSSFIHSFMHVFIHTFILIQCVFIHSSIHMRSFIHTLIHSCIHSCVHSLIHTLTHAFIQTVLGQVLQVQEQKEEHRPRVLVESRLSLRSTRCVRDLQGNGWKPRSRHQQRPSRGGRSDPVPGHTQTMVGAPGSGRTVGTCGEKRRYSYPLGDGPRQLPCAGAPRARMFYQPLPTRGPRNRPETHQESKAGDRWSLFEPENRQ